MLIWMSKAAIEHAYDYATLIVPTALKKVRKKCQPLLST
jgi:hypothetical protein